MARCAVSAAYSGTTCARCSLPGRSLDKPSFCEKGLTAVMQPKLAFFPECQRGGPKLLEEVFEEGAKGRAGGAGVAKVTSMTEPVS